MIEISKEKIDLALPKIQEGLKKYYFIQKQFNITNVQEDTVFQKKFNGFYKVRRNDIWRKSFYEIFENSRNLTNINFELILKQLHNNTNRIEASFTSKLIATINPNLPVLDKFVLDNTNLKLPYNGASNRFEKTVKIYSELTKKFDAFKKTENGRYLLRKFQKDFPSYNISETKMIDLVLWQTR